MELSFGQIGEEFVRVYHDRLEKVLVETSTRETVQEHDSSTLDSEQNSGNGEERRRCEVCGTQFKRESDAIRHHKSVHSNEEHRCAECNKPFARRDALQRHGRTKGHHIEDALT